VKGKYSRTAQDHHIRDALQCGKENNGLSKEIKDKRNEEAIELELAAQTRESIKTIKRR